MRIYFKHVADKVKIMDISDLRRENLQKLIDRHGGQASLSNAVNYGLDKSDKMISASQLSQIMSGRAFGEKLARKIEKGLSLDDGWLDVRHQAFVMEATPFVKWDDIGNKPLPDKFRINICLKHGELKGRKWLEATTLKPEVATMYVIGRVGEDFDLFVLASDGIQDYYEYANPLRRVRPVPLEALDVFAWVIDAAPIQLDHRKL